MIRKEDFIKLAKGFIQQDRYEDELRDIIHATAKKYKQELDFLGLPLATGVIMSPVLDILGDDFSYYWYDCGGDFDKFNSNITLEDGSHPEVHSLSDLYGFAKEQGSFK